MTAVSSLLAAAHSTFIAYRLARRASTNAMLLLAAIAIWSPPTQADSTEVRNMPDPKPEKARLPPRWFIRLFWITHRRLYRLTGGRLGPRQVTGRAAQGDERERLWARWREINKNSIHTPRAAR